MKNKALICCSTLFFLLSSIFNTHAQNFWQPTNGPQGGIYRDISSNLTTGNIYLVTHWSRLKGNGLGSNIFISNNSAAGWTEIDNGLNMQPVYGLAHSSVNGNLVISVMDADVPLTPSIPTKIYFSANNGSNWVLMNNAYFAGNLPPVAMIFSAAADTIFAGQRTNGISYSKDSGVTWQTMNTGITNTNITDLEYGYNGALYAATDSVSGNGGKVFVKNGATWTNAGSGLPNTRINDLYYDAASLTLYAALANFQFSTGAVYKSVSGGAWTKINGDPGIEVAKIITASNGDPVIRVLNQGVWRYNSGTWSAINTNLSSMRTSGISRDKNGNVFVTTGAGIYQLNEPGNTWNYFTNGIKNSQGRSLAFSEAGDLIVGTDNGMYKSPDGGTTWMQTGLTDAGMMSTMLYKPDGRLFAGNSDNTASHVYTSSDNGSSWSLNETGFSSTRSTDFSYNKAGKIFAGTGWSRPVHSSTNGINWNGPFWSTLGFSASTVCIAVAVDSSDNIFAGTEAQGVLRSTNNGTSYSWVGFSGGDVTDIQVAPNNDVYVAHDVYSAGSANGALYRSVDGGNNWSANLMPAHGLTNCIYIANNDSIYVGTTLGVWFSATSGNSWTLLNSGLNSGNVVVHTLELSPDGYLYAGTAGAGIYRSVNKLKGNVVLSLPVTTITAFTGALVGNKNQLNWTTLPEHSNRGFYVQRSTDNINFNNIAFVNSAAPGGNSNTAINYMYIDQNAPAANAWYRLIQANFSGGTSFSNTLLLNRSGIDSFSVNAIYPNPAINILHVNIRSIVNEHRQFRIIDMLGSTVSQQTVYLSAGDNIVNLPVSDLTPGVYVLQMLKDNGESRSKKFIKY
ncbi:MAG: T9SS type A sorting domain-containing protein [Chitinophagaceae bacterium]|nr:T9SS type A sorting domain-containing protein [Chitinophagaceae bacterium]